MKYQEVQAIRAKYPEVLTAEQQEEILDQIVLKKDSTANLGFNLNGEKHEKTEIELFWKYEARYTAFKAKGYAARVAAKKKMEPDLHRIEGALLYTYVKQCYESEDRTTTFKERTVFATNIFNAWKNSVPKELFEAHLVGVREYLVIHDAVHAKYHPKPDPFSIFLKKLIAS